MKRVKPNAGVVRKDHSLKMAASGAAETFGLIENLGPKSPAVSLNS